jgi:mRNA-degrading endonuclease RelE of RelBE toxin-antitoxin system
VTFTLMFTEPAEADFKKLASETHSIKRFKAVKKALGYLSNDPRHPSLNTHKYKGKISESRDEIFEAYAENNCPGAYRIFWYYGPKQSVITIITIVQHP